MSRGHSFEVCRAAYQCAREDGAPPVMVTQLSPDYLVLETKDGKVRMDGVRPYYDGCCRWAMKLECAEKWLALRDREAKNKKT